MQPPLLGAMGVSPFSSATVPSLLAKVHAALNATEATMTAVDRLGFHLRLKTSEGMKEVRINFLRETQSANETRTVLVEIVRAAEAKT